jgi:hypothetical protein
MMEKKKSFTPPSPQPPLVFALAALLIGVALTSWVGWQLWLDIFVTLLGMPAVNWPQAAALMLAIGYFTKSGGAALPYRRGETKSEYQWRSHFVVWADAVVRPALVYGVAQLFLWFA